ncbi:nuclear transport factor 2 family protein [Echinicola jeungdonensis]|uniref:Nuclear transport factor 2 family protein n=1 Tax=Echinicola jeungdonensis TaxID=709343 RepID=A0ABV5J0N3_9BACT|nr:nuclear transport factor 2 family protein [Echinicola jeungdonensis]MDN3667822.1 nuclear transport factor 2 family protein [Echinicola jeungdonensis]
MDAKKVISTWFDLWKSGDFLKLPLSENFIHTSPYGTIKGKTRYLQLVEANKNKFLNHKFEIHDILHEKDKVCVRYTAIQENFRLEVSEWHYVKDGLIEKVIAYYNIPGEIREDRKINFLDK